MRNFILTLALISTSANAQEEDLSQFGDLNREELTLNRVIENIRRGEVSMTSCAAGYFMTKKGDHNDARLTFETCANAGNTAAMAWMGYLDDNGLGNESGIDPEGAAEWNKRAAELGDPIGMFNHGIDLMRGWGVAENTEAGRQFVDRAAAQGVEIAQRLQGAYYDLNEITPDADNWKFSPLF